MKIENTVIYFDSDKEIYEWFMSPEVRDIETLHGEVYSMICEFDNKFYEITSRKSNSRDGSNRWHLQAVEVKRAERIEKYWAAV